MYRGRPACELAERLARRAGNRGSEEQGVSHGLGRTELAPRRHVIRTMGSLPGQIELNLSRFS